MTGLHNSNITIIEDITQSCLSDHGLTIAYGDYIIASLRKWFPIPDGAILISRQGTALVDLELESGVNDYSFYYFIAQIMKQHYLYGQKFNKNVFLQFTRKATDALFSDYTIRDMTDLSKGLLNSQNIKEIIVSRRRNYNRLYQKINNPNIEKLFYLQSNDVPIGFPVICKNRDLLKQYLINNDIYCNVHWEIKNQIQLKDLQCAKLSKNILTIPCDQRYSVNEMDYMIDKINKFHIGKEL